MATRDGRQFIFVVIPKPPPVVLEPLMVFENSPEAPSSPTPDAQLEQCRYAPASDWTHGTTVVPVVINGNGDLRRSTDFPQIEFASLKEAYDLCGPFDSIVEFYALFGYVVIDKVYMLVASEIQLAATLPFRGSIHRILQSKWVTFELPGVAPVKISASDKERLRNFQEYTFTKGYYYSDDFDLRLSFPFVRAKENAQLPNFRCDWSEHLRSPFRAASLRSACSVLIRGFAGEKKCTLHDASEVHVLLLGRQNNLNPGPRFFGRGLNSGNAAGNDYIYEYIVWRNFGGDAVTYARHTILRGTIPVHWTTQMNMSLSEPAMIFSTNKSEVIDGSSTYFDTTFEKLLKIMRMDSNNTTTRHPQLRCISMLRLNPSSGEDVLARHYVDAVRNSDSVIKSNFPQGSLDLVHVDWLNMMKEYGIDFALSSFWESSMGFLGRTGDFDDSMMSIGLIKSDGCVGHLTSQSRFLRINCADSLDRTNLGCFFTCLQVTIGMLITLQVPLTSFLADSPIPPLDPSDELDKGTAYSAAFAPVSGAKVAVPKPFLSTWQDARDPQRLPPAAARALAELFVNNGDCVAMLYTSSQAMHSNILRGICGMRPTGYNAVIATQRKYENAFEDRKKLRHLELLLGKNNDMHFPSISQVYLTRPVPYKAWAAALIGLGMPKGTTATDADDAVRRSWDANVVPWLQRNGQVPINSSTLCLTVTLEGDHWDESHDAFAAAVNQLAFASPPQEQPDGETSVNSQNIAVIEFDSSICTVLDAPTLLRRHGGLIIKGQNIVLAPYAYPVSNVEDSGGVGEAVKNVGTSLKRGIKNFVRNLN